VIVHRADSKLLIATNRRIEIFHVPRFRCFAWSTTSEDQRHRSSSTSGLWNGERNTLRSPSSTCPRREEKEEKSGLKNPRIEVVDHWPFFLRWVIDRESIPTVSSMFSSSRSCSSVYTRRVYSSSRRRHRRCTIRACMSNAARLLSLDRRVRCREESEEKENSFTRAGASAGRTKTPEKASNVRARISAWRGAARRGAASLGELQKMRAVNVASWRLGLVVKIWSETRHLVRSRRNMDDSSPRKGCENSRQRHRRDLERKGMDPERNERVNENENEKPSFLNSMPTRHGRTRQRNFCLKIFIAWICSFTYKL